MINANDYLSSIPMWTKKKNSLEEVRRFLEKLGNPDRDLKVIHVAGTNGKGSVCAFLTSMLLESGYRVGTFVSPHLVNIRERFLFQGMMIDAESFEESFHQVFQVVKDMQKEGYCHPTFFEFLFLMAVTIFQQKEVEYLVLETGLGGRLDTTNVVERPAATVITSIGMDHMAYLGDTVEKIASEKAGIIKPKIPVIAAGNQPNVLKVIAEKAKQQQSDLFVVSEQELVVKQRGHGFTALLRDLKEDEVPLFVPFRASYQTMNAAVAYRTLEVLKPDQCTKECMISGIRKTKWPGRMEEVLPGVWLDGAHNEEGIRAFCEAALLIAEQEQKQIYLLFAAVEDKDYRRMIHLLTETLPLTGIAVAGLNSERETEIQKLVQEFKKTSECTVSVFANAMEGFRKLLDQRGEDGLLFVTGSLYLIGEIKAGLER